MRRVGLGFSLFDIGLSGSRVYPDNVGRLGWPDNAWAT